MVPVAAGQSGAFAVLASNNTLNAYANGQVIVNVGALPLTGTICQTAMSGQCLSPPTNPLGESFTSGQSETFSVFLQSQGTAINGGTVTVTFQDMNGTVLGSTSVTVQTF
jgi:hypothetical protein